MTASPHRLSNRLRHPLTSEHLELLAQIAASEQEAFFERNPHQRAFYGSRFLGAALCQGAALHYIGRGTGVKDLDIHFFYQQNPERPRMSRTVYSIQQDVLDFGLRDIDFVRTLVPPRFAPGPDGDLVEVLRAFLREKPSANAHHLAEKAVVLLLPRPLLGTVVWPEQPPDDDLGATLRIPA